VVSTTWLNGNLKNPNVVVIDLRDPQAYAAGHVSGSLSLPYQGTPLWTSRGPDNETLVFPSPDVIANAFTENGLGTNGWVVLVPDATMLPGHMSHATRAAATLRYAGLPIRNLAILDGGYPAWTAAKLPISTNTTARPKQPSSINITTKPDTSFLIERAAVRSRIGKAAEGIVIIDARGTADFHAGHIPSAISLPGTTIWNAGGFWKSAGELQALFEAAVGSLPVGKGRGEVIVYCWIGQLATTWVYALTNVLGWENVKLYDGSFEDWTKFG
ncbi:Rhodanese-like domain-containing protein, partial [Immersiella caudata]